MKIELRILANGKGGISLISSEELGIYANVPVNSMLYKQLKKLLAQPDKFTWEEGQVDFIEKE